MAAAWPGSIQELLKPIATAMLKGILQGFLKESVNSVNAPMLAEQHGISVSQSKGIGPANYAHLISCRIHSKNWSKAMTKKRKKAMSGTPRTIAI